MKDILSVIDVGKDDFLQVLDAGDKMKARYRKGIHDPLFEGKTLGMYFEKPSLRTRVSLECAVHSLGGGAVCLEASGPGQLWERETIRDQARVMSRFVSAVSMRTFSQEAIEEFAREATVPVMNVLSDFEHPTQAMADFMTMRERLGDLRGKTLTYCGDGNNVARSLLSGCAFCGMRFIWSGPAEYRIEREYVDRVKDLIPDVAFIEEADPFKAVRQANAVYTDVWASMGQEDEAEQRSREFMPYQVNEELMERAPKDVIVMHCLPAHRAVEITDGVMDGMQSAVYDQSENRMHIYRGLFSLWTGDWAGK